MAYTLAARQQAIGELFRFQVRVAGHVLEPFEAVARRVLQAQHLHAPLRLVGRIGFGERRAAGQFAGQRDRVLEGELGTRADREVRGVGRVAEQDALTVGPALVGDVRKTQPRIGQMARVAHQTLPVEVFAEQRLAERDGLFRVRLV